MSKIKCEKTFHQQELKPEHERTKQRMQQQQQLQNNNTYRSQAHIILEKCIDKIKYLFLLKANMHPHKNTSKCVNTALQKKEERNNFD